MSAVIYQARYHDSVTYGAVWTDISHEKYVEMHEHPRFDVRVLYTQATTVVPEGGKLVPVEPTSDMLDEIHLDVSFSHRAMTVRYGAMLDAAPEAPGQEKDHG